MKKITGTLFRRGDTWYLKWKKNRKEFRVSTGKTDRAEAEKEKARILHPFLLEDEGEIAKQLLHRVADREKEAAAAREAAREKLLIAEAWAEFDANPRRPQICDGHLEDYRLRWDRFARWLAENHPELQAVEDITPAHAGEFAKSLAGLSPNRYNKILQGCRLVIRILIPGFKPFEGIPTKTLNTQSHRELSTAELKDVCQRATGEFRPLFAIGLYTALRLGDACQLRWEEVKLDANMIVRAPGKSRRQGKILKIPIHPVLRIILEETPAEKRREYVIPGLADLYKRDRSALPKQIRKIFVAANIKTQETVKGQKNKACLVGFHSLRHSFVTICAQAGVPLAVVQELCGHGSPAIQRAYIHMGAEAAGQAIRALPAVVDGVKAPESPLDLAIAAMDEATGRNWKKRWAEVRKLVAKG